MLDHPILSQGQELVFLSESPHWPTVTHTTSRPTTNYQVETALSHWSQIKQHVPVHSFKTKHENNWRREKTCERKRERKTVTIPGKFALSVCPSPWVSVFLQGPDVWEPQGNWSLHHIPLCTRRLSLTAVITLPIETCIIFYKNRDIIINYHYQNHVWKTVLHERIVLKRQNSWLWIFLWNGLFCLTDATVQ